MQLTHTSSWQASNYGQPLKGPAWTVKIYTTTPLIWNLPSVLTVKTRDVSIKDLTQGCIMCIGLRTLTAALDYHQSLAAKKTHLLILVSEHIIRWISPPCSCLIRLCRARIWAIAQIRLGLTGGRVMKIRDFSQQIRNKSKHRQPDSVIIKAIGIWHARLKK